jgi:hypothetical protein
MDVEAAIPRNLFLDSEYHLRIGDFGLAMKLKKATEIFIEQQIVGTCCGKPRGRLGDGIGPFAWRGLGEEICRFKLIKRVISC